MKFIRTGKLSQSEVRLILSESMSFIDRFHPAMVTAITADSNKGKYDPKVRKSKIFFPQAKDAPKTFNILHSLIMQEYRNTNLTLSMLPEIQFVIYDIGDKFVKHRDNLKKFDKLDRGLTLSLNLTDSDKYEGGSLIVYDGENKLILQREPGSYIVFPSHMIHEVTEITKGTRNAVVSWCHFSKPEIEMIKREK